MREDFLSPPAPAPPCDDVLAVSEKPPADVLGALPRSRPHRRSEKRRARPVDVEAAVAAVESAAASQPEPAAPKKASAAPKEASAAPRKAGPAPKKATPKSVVAPRKAGPSAKPGAASKAASTVRGEAPSKPAAVPKPPAPAARPARATRAKPRLEQPAQPTGTPDARRPDHPLPGSRHDLLGTAVQAAAELAEIGLSVGARALRQAVSRLPKP
jgi:translation initiation factor IF-3